MTRVLGEAMARVAATTAGHFVEAFLRPGDTELEVAERFAALAEQLTPALEPVLVAAFKAHLREAVRRGMIGREERAAGRVDQGPAAGGLLRRRRRLHPPRRRGRRRGARRTSPARSPSSPPRSTESPVRLVKTIGDAAMFVSPEPGAARRGRAVAGGADRGGRAPAAAGRDRLRTGAAALRRRVRPLGEPRQPGHGHRAAGQRARAPRRCATPPSEDYEWSFAGRHRLKGVKEPPALHRARLRPAAARRPSRLGASETPSRSITNTSGAFGRDRRRAALRAVGEVRRDDQLAPAADLHAGDALVPPRDHRPLAEL